jgi:superfamily II DNA/RNA helicase
MLTSESSNFTKIYGIEKFKDIIKKLTIDYELSNSEKSYILSVALIFLEFYKKDKRYKSYREFAYYIILKYSLKYSDYKPLFDFSTAIGFFPISKEIIDKNLIEIKSINELLVNEVLETYKIQDKYIETLEQHSAKKHLLSNQLNEIAYIAPTSFGKSSVLLDLIKENEYFNKKTVIVVPTKSLLMQTYKMIRNENFDTRLLMHDEMYNNDNSFIAVFTQERALRLLNKGILFDVMFIDEAHNLMDNDFRAILLSRLIKKNSLLNPQQKIIYLSPLVVDQNKLKVNSQQFIGSSKISFNLKEAEIFEYRTNRKAYVYNKFVNDFFEISEYSNALEYCLPTLKEKNFFFVRQPKKVEELAKSLSNNLPTTRNENIDELIEVLKDNIHEDFYVIDLLKKGIIYLHGKMPYLIKEYLEYKFKNLNEIKYLVANSVILEGINLPIDNLYVLNTYKLDAKKLINLIGRVNRLDQIFSREDVYLTKLLPSVHFVNSRFNGVNSKMKNKIETLRKSFNDKINNPTLYSFDTENLDENAKEKAQFIIDNEELLLENSDDERIKLIQYCIENGINTFYKNFENVINKFLRNIQIVNENRQQWDEYSVLEKLSAFFISNIDDIDDFSFNRLMERETIKYYERFINRMHKYSLKDNINDLFTFYKTNPNNEYYIGMSYGEFARSSSVYPDGRFNVYIDLTTKSDKELINIAIIKLQIEENYVKYTINKFIEMMYSYDLISENDYNLYIYGTETRKNIDLIKFGLSPDLVTRLENDGQLDNISISKNGKIEINEEFKEFKNGINDFYRFEIERYL